MTAPRASVRVGAHVVHGLPVDEQTRCAHYSTELDVLAILFPCCGRWYPCHACHEETADHAARPWGAGERETQALLCGRCGRTSSIREYVATCACAHCGGAFNPGCRRHHHLYFDTPQV